MYCIYVMLFESIKVSVKVGKALYYIVMDGQGIYVHTLQGLTLYQNMLDRRDASPDEKEDFEKTSMMPFKTTNDFINNKYEG